MAILKGVYLFLLVAVYNNKNNQAKKIAELQAVVNNAWNKLLIKEKVFQILSILFGIDEYLEKNKRIT